MRRSRSVTVAAGILGLTLGVRANGDTPMANPADKHPAGTNTVSAVSGPVHTWELPAIPVVGQAPSPLREEDRIGDYGQPRWTADRRFPRNRIYVIPDGKVEFEYWLRLDVPKEGPTEVQNFYELEFGLPYRLQLDLYLVARNEGEGGPTYLDQQFELRYALADWGVLPGNPTLYAEYALRDDAPDKVEGKFLLGDELAPRWHWGANLVYEAEIAGEDLEHEYAATLGLSYTVLDEKLSVGAEAEASFVDTKANRGDYSKEVYVGPSIQYRPRKNAHIDVAPLLGVTDDAKRAKVFAVFGWEF